MVHYGAQRRWSVWLTPPINLKWWGHQTDQRVMLQEIGILPPCSIHGMWGSRNTSCDGLANKKQSVYLPRCLCTVVTVSELVCFILIDSTLVKWLPTMFNISSDNLIGAFGASNSQFFTKMFQYFFCFNACWQQTYLDCVT